MSPRPRSRDKDMPTYVHWKNGAWRYKTPAHLRNYVSGRKTWVTLGTDKKEALKKYAELVGNLSAESGMSKLFNRYAAEVIPSKAPRTQKDNTKELKKLRGVFGEMHPSELSTMHCQQYLDVRGQSSKTQANHEIALLSHIFRKAMQWGIVDRNPVKGVEKHKAVARDRYVEDWELDEFLSVATPFILAWVEVKVMTGLRQGDMLAMPLSALRDDGIRFKSSKTGRKGFIPWTRELKMAVAALTACNRKNGLTIVCNRSGKPLSDSSFQNRWRAVMTRALENTDLAERFTEHDLRAKHATDVDAAGGDATANLLHDDKRTTEDYLRAKKSVTITAWNRKKPEV
jgi:integrase